MPARAVGAKLLKRNLSDLAAMGGRATAAVLAVQRIMAPKGAPAVSPDGTKVAFVRSDGTNNQIWVSTIAGAGAAVAETRSEDATGM